VTVTQGTNTQEFEQLLVHTGQHYDDNMPQVFFEELELPQPDIYLGVGSGSHVQQTARIMLAFEPVLRGGGAASKVANDQ
jgi:UDP-N-acetylglucosamine 2-epimerase (non-hydrolysing)